MAGVKSDMSGWTRIMKGLDSRVDETLEAVALELQSEIDANYSAVPPSAPGEPPAIDSGDLRDSSRVERVEAGQWEVSVGNIKDDVADYANIQEFGSVNQEPRPFFQPAIDRVQEAYGEHFEGLFDD